MSTWTNYITGPVEEDVAESAAQNGHLNVLKYLHERGCDFGNSCLLAVMGRQLECLKYAHKMGGQWDHGCVEEAVRVGDIEILKYLNEHGCKQRRISN